MSPRLPRFPFRPNESVLSAAILAALPTLAAAEGLHLIGAPPYDPVAKTGYQGDYEGYPARFPYFFVSNSGVGVGFATKYVGNKWLGARPLCWDAAGGYMELEVLGARNDGTIHVAENLVISSLGTLAGTARKHVNGADLGARAVRWDASGHITELGCISQNTTTSTQSYAYAINSAGTIVGSGNKNIGATNYGDRAIRWLAGSSVPTELGVLSTSASGWAGAGAWAVNDAGTAVGFSWKHAGGVSMGTRAVRWDPGTTLATELGNLAGNYTGNSNSECSAVAINGDGIIGVIRTNGLLINTWGVGRSAGIQAPAFPWNSIASAPMPMVSLMVGPRASTIAARCWGL